MPLSISCRSLGPLFEGLAYTGPFLAFRRRAHGRKVCHCKLSERGEEEVITCPFSIVSLSTVRYTAFASVWNCLLLTSTLSLLCSIKPILLIAFKNTHVKLLCTVKGWSYVLSARDSQSNDCESQIQKNYAWSESASTIACLS